MLTLVFGFDFHVGIWLDLGFDVGVCFDFDIDVDYGLILF